MDIQVENNILILSGILDEECTMEELKEALSTVQSIGLSQPLEVNFSGVQRANSMGIILWLKFLQESGIQVCYVDAPIWLVNQFNLIQQFFKNKSLVRSFFAPFYCVDDDSVLNIKFEIGKEVQLLSSYDNFEIANRDIEGKDFEPDFNPPQYLSFLSHIKNHFEE